LHFGGPLTDDQTMIRRAGIFVLILATLAACRLRDDHSTPAAIPAPPDVAAPPADAARTPSGLASKVLKVGVTNVRPTLSSTVRVNYTGWTTDGKMFDSSVARGEPIEFQVTGVIPGWTEGLQLMVIGEKRRFWIPGNLAYGDGPPGGPGDPPTGMLVFDIELLDVK
jgi:peptidylprolyl isomerase